MNSYEENVVCIYRDIQRAEAAVARLKEEGISTEHVSLIVTSLKDEQQLKEAINAGDEAEHDALLGAGAGGLLGLLAGGVGVVTWGGVGLVVVAGPIFGAGIAAGALIGAMAGWGVHKDDVARWERQLSDGKVLVVAHGDGLLAADAYNILRETHPVEIKQFSQTDQASEADA